MTGIKWLITSGILAVILVAGSVSVYFYTDSRLLQAMSEGQNDGAAAGYADGYKEGGVVGYDEGHAEGYGIGEPEGYEAGLDKGYEEGEAAGYLEGEAAGYADGRDSGYEEGNSSGFRTGETLGYSQGYETEFRKTVSDAMVYNPTYDRAMELLRKSGQYTATGIADYFDQQGVRIGYVWMKVINGEGLGYALVAFDTIDRGIIIILPKTREEITPEVGNRVSEVANISAPDFDDTISDITIIW